MERETSYEIIEGRVRKKETSMSTHPKAPAGTVAIEGDNGRKFTVWKADKLDKVIVGANVRIMFEVKDSIVGDKEYKNYNVVRIEDVSIKVDQARIDFTEEEKEILSYESVVASVYTDGEGCSGLTILGHKLVVEDVDDIQVPQDVYDYLVTKGFIDVI